MVLNRPFPPDSRVERQASTLAEAGFEVHLLCEARPGELELEAYYQQFYLHRVNPEDVTFSLFNLKTRFPYQGVCKNLVHSLWNVDTAWHTLIDRFVSCFGLDALHVHDLPLVHTAVNVAEKHHIPLVVDLPENYPALMEMLYPDPIKAQEQRKKWDNIEQLAAWEADAVITSIDEARDRLMKKGIAPNKISVIPNLLDTDHYLNQPWDPSVIKRYKATFLLTYVGHLNGPHRGIYMVLEAMARLQEEIPELYFVGAGALSPRYRDQLQAHAERLGVAHQVEWTDWLDEPTMISTIQAADICLCPHVANDYTQTTFPSKVLLYHLFQKPVIASDCRPLARYLQDSGGGLTFQSGDAHALTRQILSLYQNNALRRQLGEAGKKAVLSRYQWTQTAPALIHLYDQLLRRQTLAPV
jgi:glycosyltransferase involved in cell wall biosynthesis